jgi:predicted nucleic acid-binding protein
MSSKAIVIDANILIRAVLGRRVLELIVEYAADVDVVAPDVAYADARKYLPQLLKKRGLSADAAMTMLDRLETVVNVMGCEDYVAMKERALQRIAVRDADDWPVLACALVLGCPVWTEDADFLGTGVATWTTDRVALYFRSAGCSGRRSPPLELATLSGYDR